MIFNMMNRDSSVYSRRKAFMDSVSSGYLRISVSGSREKLDDIPDDASSDTGSVRSTTSTRSYRSWRRARDRKRQSGKLERTQSLFGESASDHFNFNLNLNRMKIDTFSIAVKSSFPSKDQRSRGITSTRNVPSSSSVDSTALKIHREADEVAHHELSTIAQSPLEAFYSSSSLDTSSDEEDPDQVRRLNSLTEADPHKETRDWLISRSLDSEEAKPRAKVVSYAKIIAKPEEEQSRLPVHLRDFGTGLNQLLEIAEAETPPTGNEVIENSVQLETDKATSPEARKISTEHSSASDLLGIEVLELNTSSHSVSQSLSRSKQDFVPNREILVVPETTAESETMSYSEKTREVALSRNDNGGTINKTVKSSAANVVSSDVIVSTPINAARPSFDQSAILHSTVGFSTDTDPENPRTCSSENLANNRYKVIADVTAESIFEPDDLPSIKESDGSAPPSGLSPEGTRECEVSLSLISNNDVDSGTEYTLKDLSLPSLLSSNAVPPVISTEGHKTPDTFSNANQEPEALGVNAIKSSDGAFSEKLDEIRQDVSEITFFKNHRMKETDEHWPPNGDFHQGPGSDLTDPFEEMLLQDEERKSSCKKCAELKQNNLIDQQRSNSDQEAAAADDQPSRSSSKSRHKRGLNVTGGDQSQLCSCCSVM